MTNTINTYAAITTTDAPLAYVGHHATLAEAMQAAPHLDAADWYVMEGEVAIDHWVTGVEWPEAQVHEFDDAYPDEIAFADRVAAKFRALLVEDLTADELAEMDRRNAAQTDPNICHSHDFLDANDVMAAAFEAVAGCAPDPDCEVVARAWGNAWEIAKTSLSGVGC